MKETSSIDERAGEKDGDLNYLEYVSELERPYDTTNFDIQSEINT